ncbi:four helix bundle protein [Candidatus Dojkabacteria bacterium]|uniref:Four helix bundle protein n=1 Tax=Candidatus Dojkabacteria bacterium TaxID=2099670 RepID=A0A955RLQ7_9BACT|nr:four helix bundle protein [Candidatus Dojkabacteria bacterium]
MSRKVENPYSGFKDLIIWKRSIRFVKIIYEVTKSFPKEEIYGLTSQLRRASISIPSNIAEGSRRGSQKEFRNFLRIAFASGAEMETQLEIAAVLGYIDNAKYKDILHEIIEIQKMLNSFIKNMPI